MRELVRQEFGKGNAMPVACFPEDNAAVADTRRLTAVAVARGKAGSIVMMLARHCGLPACDRSERMNCMPIIHHSS